MIEVFPMVWEWMIYTALFLLLIIVLYEWMNGSMVQEGFTDGTHIPEFFGRFFPKRYDIVPGQQRETDGWVRNPRYFEGYVDVQRLGYKADFCRVVEKEDDPESRIMTCARAGQEGLDSFTFRTDSARSGMRFSRDDYFRDVDGDKRDDYCRIVKVRNAPHDAWESRCVLSGLTRFKQGSDVQDTEPPAHISDLLWFYEGIMVWYRWFDDMLDYGENTQVQIAGGMKIDEEPKKVLTEGLPFNRLPSVDANLAAPSDQYIRIGEDSRLTFDSVVQLTELRAVSVWVKFDEFTNNARIFDFGNGAGKDNVFLGIMGRGNKSASDLGLGRVSGRPTDANLVCQAKAPTEVHPAAFMKTTDANVELWECPGPVPIDSMFPPDEIQGPSLPPTANLVFEIWDSEQRVQRMIIQDAIPYQKWVHVALTTTDRSVSRPTWTVYVNGKKVFEHADGHLPQRSFTTKNYIGRSNWETETSQYDDRDERFRGAMFDFRMYRTPMSASKIKRTYDWGFQKLHKEKEKHLN
jgi:hypothetical protein